jgi:hypothetical protein
VCSGIEWNRAREVESKFIHVQGTKQYLEEFTNKTHMHCRIGESEKSGLREKECFWLNLLSRVMCSVIVELEERG